MKAVVFRAPKDARIEEVPQPEPGPGEVVCKVAAVGICGTDIEIYLGTMAYFRIGILSYPWTSGHEWAGIVDAVGEGVTQFKVGDRVTSETTAPCGKCEACRTGRPQMCWPRNEVGCTGRYPGAFADYVRVPTNIIYKVPAGVSLQEASMTEPAGVAMHGIELMRIDPGERILVIGDGPIGVLAAKEAKANGASMVVLLGSREYKMKAALLTGVDRVVSRHDPRAAELAIEALGGVKADSIIETSGNATGLALAERLIRLGGKLSVLSLYGVPNLPIDIDSIVLNEIQVTTGLGAANTYPRVLRMMQSKQLKMLPLQASRPFDQFISAIEDVANKRTTTVKTVVVHEEWLD
jgi:L-iditol 2-dehydrogenase